MINFYLQPDRHSHSKDLCPRSMEACLGSQVESDYEWQQEKRVQVILSSLANVIVSLKKEVGKGAHTQARTIPLCLNSDRGLSHVGVAGTSNVQAASFVVFFQLLKSFTETLSIFSSVFEWTHLLVLNYLFTFDLVSPPGIF